MDNFRLTMKQMPLSKRRTTRNNTSRCIKHCWELFFILPRLAFGSLPSNINFQRKTDPLYNSKKNGRMNIHMERLKALYSTSGVSHIFDNISTRNIKIMDNNRKKLRPYRNGFTLLEVMLVLFILVSLAAMTVTVVRGTQQKARIQMAISYINLLENCIERYEQDIGQPPTTQQGLAALLSPPDDLPNPADWAGPYLKDKAKSRDPWGNEYQYISPGTHSRNSFEIWSFGPDRIDGTSDDITSWKVSD